MISGDVPSCEEAAPVVTKAARVARRSMITAIKTVHWEKVA